MVHLRRPLLVPLLVCALGASLAFASAPSEPQRRLLSLGDSLATGTQPRVAKPEANEGYATLLERRLGRELTVLGRGGATTASMLANGQEANAVAYLRAHVSDDVVVTISIGANDVERCAQGGTFPAGCVEANLRAVRANLPVILRRLQAAAGPHVTFVGLTYYDAFLAHWRDGATGRAYVRRAMPVERRMNATIAAAYRAAGVAVADVTPRFHSEDLRDALDVPDWGRLPLGVARICSWTWACKVPDDHPDARGYRAIAATIFEALPAAERSSRADSGGATAQP